ncbi:hypothetical protein UK30_10280 [Salmonella enterica]|nr:hypothetical protein [Salmonella enterica]
MSIINFSANFANCYTEYNVPIIGIGDDPEEPEHYIIISQFIDKDESIDETIGLQGHFFDGEVSNAIKKIELKREQILIDIKEDKIKKTGTSRVDINLHITKEQFALLISYIQDIFSQSNTLIKMVDQGKIT